MPDRHKRIEATARIVERRRRDIADMHQDWRGGPAAKRLTHGFLSKTAPFDCGNPSCGVCRDPQGPGPKRRKADRAWRREWNA